jgi:hypothetical protein
MDVKGKLYSRFIERSRIFEEQQNDSVREKQHSKGKMTAKERIDMLFDPDTFEEIDAFSLPAVAGGDFVGCVAKQRTSCRYEMVRCFATHPTIDPTLRRFSSRHRLCQQWPNPLSRSRLTR